MRRYSVLHSVAQCYDELRGDTRSYAELRGITQSYAELRDITRNYGNFLTAYRKAKKPVAQGKQAFLRFEKSGGRRGT